MQMQKVDRWFEFQKLTSLVEDLGIQEHLLGVFLHQGHYLILRRENGSSGITDLLCKIWRLYPVVPLEFHWVFHIRVGSQPFGGLSRSFTRGFTGVIPKKNWWWPVGWHYIRLYCEIHRHGLLKGVGLRWGNFHG